MKRICLIVLDSVGIGALPDAAKFGDEDAHTLGNILKKRGSLELPHLYSLGLSSIEDSRLPEFKAPQGAYGRLMEQSFAKDTTSGHWEICGLILKEAFRTYPEGFPKDLTEELERKIGRKIIGNKVASGTEIIKELGDEHVTSKSPIIYTSADSVLQVAAHEDIIPVEELYEICQKAYQLSAEKGYNIGRIIARPFSGKSGAYKRTENRRDFAVAPTEDTILDALSNNGIAVHGVGKIEDIFSNKGITSSNHSTNNAAGIDATIQALKTQDAGLIFTNLVDFDMLYGHRNDVEGYGKALEYFDSRLPEILELLKEEDILMITADHGCDPTTPSTDHSREYIPLVIYGKNIKPGDLGTRETFADIGATIVDYFDLSPWKCGNTFLNKILRSVIF